MIVVGIDPGFDRIGWAAGQALASGKINLLSFGLIETDKTQSVWQRYEQIDLELTAIIQEFGVEEAAVESLFFFKNQKTVIQVAEARGVILSALIREGVKISQYTPPQIKLATTGYGRADKTAIAKMVKLQLELAENQQIIDDTYDAMAILLTHCGSRKLKISSNSKKTISSQ